MKMVTTVLVLLATVYVACTDSNARYIDLNTGEEITVVKDSSTGYAVNGETKEPVRFYVNTSTKDTIDGRTGEVISKRLIKRDNGTYVYWDDADTDRSSSSSSASDNDGEYKIKDGDYKKKVDDDGSVKIKDGDTKIKIDENGNKKVKKDD